MKLKRSRVPLIAAAVSTAVAVSVARAETDPGFITISLSGSTAMRNFTIGSSTGAADSGLTMLPNGASIVLNGITYGPYNQTGGFQEMAPFSNPASAVPSTGAASQLRVEWYENGATEGIRDLVNSWNGNGFTPNFNSGANPVWVNRNKFVAVGPTTVNGWTLTSMNPVQMSISDMNAKQAFSVAGSGAFNITVGAAGFGQGNPAAPHPQPILDQSLFNGINSGGLGLTGVDKTDNKVIAMQSGIYVANPGTGLGQLNRTDAQFLDTTGRLKNGLGFDVTLRDQFSGTHNVVQLDSGVDPSWGVGVSDGDSSNKNTLGNLGFSNKSTGGNLRQTVRISRMAIGELGNSDANGNTLTTSANPLRALAYSDSAGGLSPYVAPSVASITDGTYAIVLNETYVTLKTDDNASGIIASNSTDSSTRALIGNTVLALRNNILNSVSNFPNPSTANTPADRLLSTGFLLPQMMITAKALNGVGNNQSNLASAPRTGLTFEAYDQTRISDSTLPSSYVDWQGITRTDQMGTLRDILLNSSDPNIVSYRNKFQNTSVANPNASSTTVTSGIGSTYGAGVAPGGGNTLTNATPIDGVNYFFGNFNSNYVRDLSSLRAAETAQTAMETAGVTKSYFDGNAGQIANTANVTYTDDKGVSRTFTKGSLITMGDFNGDGLFNGQDLYLIATHAAASDASGTGFANGTVTTNGGGTSEGNFGDVIRSSVLRKNAALDYLQSHATTQQKTEAAALDLGGTASSATAVSNAFNKFDINRDGKVNVYDAKVVKNFNGMHADSITDQTSAVITGSTSGLAGPSGNHFISLYDAIFTDGNTVVDASQNAGSDLRQLQSSILGDMNLDGVINNQDIAGFVQALTTGTGSWAANYVDLTGADAALVGDFNHDGAFNNQDIAGFVSRLTGGIGPFAATPGELTLLSSFAAVPEPASLALVGGGAILLLGRRRRHAR